MHAWRERLFRWLSPLARRCPVAPNTITVVALAMNLGAAALLYERHFLIAIVVVALAGLADAFDGIVARVQQKESQFGDFLDHVADRISDTLLVAGWLLGSAAREPFVLAAVFVVMLNGYLGTQIEATFGQRRYDGVGRGEFVLALIVFPIVSAILFRNGWGDVSAAGLRMTEWLAVVLVAVASLAIAQRIAMAARMERGR